MSDGKEFAVVAIGSMKDPTRQHAIKNFVSFEAEDGERVEYYTPSHVAMDWFERIED